MKGLYLALDVGSLIVPFIFSFHPKIRFYKKFKSLFSAIFISGLVYLSWDVIFTLKGYWGFNDAYLLGVRFLNLPIEEWLFFVCIPFASVFTHYTLTKLNPSVALGPKATKIISIILLFTLLSMMIFNYQKAYTFYNALCTFSILLISMWLIPKELSTFYLTFSIVLIPFLIVNGILTGSFIEDPVVWYNDAENLGIRIFTIPVEDTFYAMGMLLLTVLLTELFERKRLLQSSS
jgi:lycopene cyclase domain-containing protein